MTATGHTTHERPADPTAYRPAAIVASQDTQVGTELEPVVKRVTLDKTRLYQGWPQARNRHTDYAAAQATGLREPNVSGGQTAEYLGQMFMRFFGPGFAGGRLAVSFLGFVNLDDEVTVRGTVTDRAESDDGRVWLEIRMTAETQDGRTVLAGKASGFVPELDDRQEY
jgi:acyl dehydratase